MSHDDHEHENATEPSGGEEKALEHLHQAEIELEEVHALERKAEHEIEEAIEELKEARKDIDITVNGRHREVKNKVQTYKDIAKLAYPDADFNTYLYTITYFNGEHGREGDLVEGEKVHVVNGMVFNVRRSDKS